MSGLYCFIALLAFGLVSEVFGATEWKLILRVTQGSGTVVYRELMKRHTGPCRVSDGCIPDNMAAVGVGEFSVKFLRSPLIDCWENKNIKRVRVEVYKQRRLLAFLLFNGIGTTKTSWFSYKHLLDSSWYDLKPGCDCRKFNYFSAAGDQQHHRHFYINQIYRGCPNDFGWFVIKQTKDVCTWGKFKSYPQFLVTNNRKGSLWQKQGAYELGDVFAVYAEIDSHSN